MAQRRTERCGGEDVTLDSLCLKQLCVCAHVCVLLLSVLLSVLSMESCIRRVNKDERERCKGS